MEFGWKVEVLANNGKLKGEIFQKEHLVNLHRKHRIQLIKVENKDRNFCEDTNFPGRLVF